MLNAVFFFLVIGAVLCGAFTGTMKGVTDASLASAKTAVDLAIGLVGQMGVWLGFMRVLQDAGLMRSLANGLAPIMRRLFPDVPPDHPAMSGMIMNLSANILGLGNAATPFGLKAMVDLDRLNPRKGVATNAMALFLAINTSGVAVLPLGVIAIRATLGSKDPGGIFLPTLLATTISTTVAIILTKILEKLPRYAPERFEASEVVEAKGGPADTALKEAEKAAASVEPAPLGNKVVAMLLTACLLWGLVLTIRKMPDTTSTFDVVKLVSGDWLLPLLMFTIVAIGFTKRVKVYESFIAGAKDAFQIAISVIPFLVAILVAIGMFRASGALEMLVGAISPISSLIGMPGEALPMALIRPLSGSGALAVMSDTMKTAGPDSLVGYMVSVMNGSTETTFYVLAVYFGAVGVRATRHTVWACIAADIAGMTAATVLTHIFFG